MLTLSVLIPLLTALGIWCGQAFPQLLLEHGCLSEARHAPRVMCLGATPGPPAMCVLPGAGVVPGRPAFLCFSQGGPPGRAEEGSLLELAVRKSPSKWIGVTLSPVPAPLAAHIGAEGLMITNVVKDSPADQAGLERYDVVIEFNGRKIEAMEDLTEAIADAPGDSPVGMTVIRRGQETSIKIAPAARSAGDWEYKYEEPEEDVVDRVLKLRGHRVRPGPGGGWIFEELGPLRKLPDVFKELEKFDKGGWGPWFDPGRWEFDFSFGPDELSWTDEEGKRVQTRVEVRVQVDDDGNVTTIWRDADGRINVKQVDPDGNESSRTYENAEEFEEQDPEAYKLYRRFGRGGGPHGWTFVRPPAGELGKIRKKFQVEVETKLRDALERAKEAQERAKERFDEAREQMRESMRHQRWSVDKPKPRMDDQTRLRVASIKIDDDGTITVTTRQNGRRTTYVFDSKEEFQQDQPELFEKVKSFFE